MNYSEPTSQPEPEQTPEFVSARARRRRALRRAYFPTDEEERAALFAHLARRAFPSYELFVFALLAGAILGLGYFFNSQSLLLFGILVAPLLTPWIGYITCRCRRRRAAFPSNHYGPIRCFIAHLHQRDTRWFCITHLSALNFQRSIHSQSPMVARYFRIDHRRNPSHHFFCSFGKPPLSAQARWLPTNSSFRFVRRASAWEAASLKYGPRVYMCSSSISRGQVSSASSHFSFCVSIPLHLAE